MITFPHAKINLGLHVTGIWKTGETRGDITGKHQRHTAKEAGANTPLPRSFDGYHTIESMFVPVKLYDILEVTDSKDDQTRIFTSGLPIGGDPDENLCLKAYHLLAAEAGGLPPASVYLHKIIPPGAGLGGGSADAAFMLRLLNKYYDLHLDRDSLFRLALLLGSDCPFFLQDKPMLATGTGHILGETALDQLHDKHLIIVVPPIHISTAWAYNQLKINKISFVSNGSLQSLCQQPITTWQGHVQNHFEYMVSKKYPRLHRIKKSLQNSGAIYTSLTGTGSGLYGVFSSRPSARDMQHMFPDCHVFCTKPAVS